MASLVDIHEDSLSKYSPDKMDSKIDSNDDYSDVSDSEKDEPEPCIISGGWTLISDMCIDSRHYAIPP